MESELSRQSFVSICDLLFTNFKRRIDVYGIRVERFSTEFLSDLNNLWRLHVHPELPSVAVTIDALCAMRDLQAKYITSSIGDYQNELRQLEKDSESLGDSFAEKFNDSHAVLFEIELKEFAEAANKQGYEASNATRDLGSFSERPWFEKSLSLAGFHVERDTPLYTALHEFFRPHFNAGFDQSFPPEFVAKLNTGGKEHDPTLN